MSDPLRAAILCLLLVMNDKVTSFNILAQILYYPQTKADFHLGESSVKLTGAYLWRLVLRVARVSNLRRARPAYGPHALIHTSLRKGLRF